MTCSNEKCKTCGGMRLVQRTPCPKCGSINVRVSDLVGMYVCATCGPYHGDLDRDDVAPCPTCTVERVECERKPCEHLMPDCSCELAFHLSSFERGRDCPPGTDENCTKPADAKLDGGGGDHSGECGDCCGRDERCSLDPDHECLIIEHQRDELVRLRADLARMTSVHEAAVGCTKHHYSSPHFGKYYDALCAAVEAEKEGNDGTD